MYIQLTKRHYGVHTPIKHLEIPCDFKDVYIANNHINEELLIQYIPDGWLPVKPKAILLAACNELGGTGQFDLKIFRPWKKYFDCYVLEIYERPLGWWSI